MSELIFDLPTGQLQLKLHQAHLPFEDLLGIGARHNPKRAFLFVSKVLGKHIPVRPQQMRHCHRLLAQQLPAFGQAALFIGMAETATGLGQGVFEAYLQQQPQTKVSYTHSSRIRAEGAQSEAFEESHSHATRVWLHLPQTEADRAHWQQAKSLVLIDDELSTGNTFANLLRQCLHLAPNIEQVFWVSIADFIGEKRQDLMAQSALPLQSISLLQGQWQFVSNGNTLPVPVVSQSNVGQEPVVMDTGYGRLGVYQASSLSNQVLAQLPAHLHSGNKVLVLGCGEFMHAALVVAENLEQQFQTQCWVQSTTRSPILKWGAIEEVMNVADPYDEGVIYFLYNVVREDYDHVLICHEQQANEALQQTAQQLKAQLISFT